MYLTWATLPSELIPMINPRDSLHTTGLRELVHNGLEKYLQGERVRAEKEVQGMQHEVSNYPTESAIEDGASLEEIKLYLEADLAMMAYYEDALVNRETWLASKIADVFPYWSTQDPGNPHEAWKAIGVCAAMLFEAAGLWKDDDVQRRRKLYDHIRLNLHRYVDSMGVVTVEGIYGRMGVIWKEFEQNNPSINTVSCEDTIVNAIMCSLYSGK